MESLFDMSHPLAAYSTTGVVVGVGTGGGLTCLYSCTVSVKGNMRVEAAFHSFPQTLSVPTQNSSPAVTVFVYIHEFNLNVSEIFCQNR